MGQDIDSIDNYVANVGIEPGGVTGYIDIRGLNGLTNQVDNGGGPNNMGYLVQEYPDSTLAIAVYLVGELPNVTNGSLDSQINTLIDTLKGWERPVYLRWGYEFDGPWNGYDPTQFIAAWRYMHTKVQAAGADNIAMVWQSSSYCLGTYNNLSFQTWWPGPEYVDWVGLSYFTPQDCNNNAINPVVQFARDNNKPAMIAESAPQRYDIGQLTYSNTINANDMLPRTADQIWTEWFSNYFDYIDRNSDVIKAVAYINADWDSQSLWAPPYTQGYWGDSRVEANATIESNWLAEIDRTAWMNASPTLFSDLTSTTAPPPPTGGGVVAREAENGTLQGQATVYQDTNASNGAGVAYLDSSGSGFLLSDTPASTGFTVVYASELSGTMSYFVDGVDAGNISFSSTGGWTGSYGTATVNVTIPAGSTLSISNQPGDTAMNVDRIEFASEAADEPPPPPPPPTANPSTLEAESGTLLGNAQYYNDASASGGQGVAYLDGVGNGFELTGVPASSSFTVTYASQLSGQVSYFIDGVDSGDISFGSTGNWVGTYQDITVDVTIPDGATFEIVNQSGDTAMNVDVVTFDGIAPQ